MRRLSTILLAVGLAVLLSAAGCSNLPTQPTGLAPSGVSANPDAGSSQILGLDGLIDSSPTTTATRTIGLLGGVVSAGNFTIIVPPGALTSTATITVSQPDPARPVVNLSISPPTANKFLLPVLLVADAKVMDRSLLAVAYMGYYNPATGAWERVAASQASVGTLTVSAPLQHFSTYRVESGGKAGW
jgi:hypothetical protein